MPHPTAKCTDIAGWSDSFGYTCADYANLNYCTSTGGFGIGWDPTWGTFLDYINLGFIATDACCTCGGGQKGVQASAGTFFLLRWEADS